MLTCTSILAMLQSQPLLLLERGTNDAAPCHHKRTDTHCLDADGLRRQTPWTVQCKLIAGMSMTGALHVCCNPTHNTPSPVHRKPAPIYIKTEQRHEL
eukprot:1148480-Pelagomonas_calceolata.AAC.3